MKDHIKLENSRDLAIWSMFMNDCMSAVFYLGEEGEKIRRIEMHHQIPKTQTLIEAVRTLNTSKTMP